MGRSIWPLHPMSQLKFDWYGKRSQEPNTPSLHGQSLCRICKAESSLSIKLETVWIRVFYKTISTVPQDSHCKAWTLLWTPSKNCPTWWCCRAPLPLNMQNSAKFQIHPQFMMMFGFPFTNLVGTIRLLEVFSIGKMTSLNPNIFAASHMQPFLFHLQKIY